MRAKDWLLEARERCEAATSGPWQAGNWTVGYDYCCWEVSGDPSDPVNDASFIANARADLPRALTALEAADRLALAIKQWEKAADDDESATGSDIATIRAWESVHRARNNYEQARSGSPATGEPGGKR